MAKQCYTVQGMHCAACEVLIERTIKSQPGVTSVKAHQERGRVDVWSEGGINLGAINHSLKAHGYTIYPGTARAKVGFKRFMGAILLVAVAYLLFKKLNLVPALSVGQELSLGIVFVMGLIAAVSSCVAVTGGLLVAVSAAQAARHPEAGGWQRFKPHLYFNVGRLVSYGALGGAVGAVGSTLALSSVGSGVVTLLASAAMVIIGFRLLEVAPWLTRFSVRPPKFIAHRLYDTAGQPKAWAPFLMGAGTFFLPCGFTQALQLYVLTRADAGVGAATMFVFALGTMPALISLGVLTSFLKGRWQRLVGTVAGAAVVALGLINLGYGLTLTGISAKVASARENLRIAASRQGVEITDPNVTWDGRAQVVKMEVVSRGYKPNHFTVRAGLPVRWEINGVNTYGCQALLQFPAFDVSKFVQPGSNIVEFTPQEPGQYSFHCSMGMYTGSFTVLPADGGTPSAVVPPAEACDPRYANCIK